MPKRFNPNNSMGRISPELRKKQIRDAAQSIQRRSQMNIKPTPEVLAEVARKYGITPKELLERLKQKK